MCVYRKEYNTFVVFTFFKCVEASHRVSKYVCCLFLFMLGTLAFLFFDEILSEFSRRI